MLKQTNDRRESQSSAIQVVCPAIVVLVLVVGRNFSIPIVFAILINLGALAYALWSVRKRYHSNGGNL